MNNGYGCIKGLYSHYYKNGDYWPVSKVYTFIFSFPTNREEVDTQLGNARNKLGNFFWRVIWELFERNEAVFRVLFLGWPPHNPEAASPLFHSS